MRWQSRNPVSKWLGAEVPAQQRRLDRGGPVSGRILSRFDKKGYEILQVPTGQEALEVSREKKPNLIFVDIYMPGDLSGIEATRLLKSDVETQDSKVIILTASNGTNQEALNAGADDYLVKPFSPLELLDKIGGFLDNDVQRVNPFKGLQERKI